ncbi:MAG: ABC transporter substrate-binding protein [Propionicimonas sp.]|uniref:ABC transporter substrate-binding protein n=1 Tax=Propionicimonas sp. TaxID=1955623 RepID=UPI002B1F2DC0|nr:ABC transporter substrate-binding protein [Propionicimonas sp.]MEA4943804.1 ABC transporter substrate-binding protein [Propionicimonas sp.]
MRLTWLLVPLLVLSGCTAAALPPESPSAPTSSGTASSPAPVAPARIGLSYIPNVQFAPFYLAEADGGFAAGTGTPATLRHHGAQEGLFTAIAAGQEDFVLAGADEMLQARESGADLVAVATYYRQYPVQLIVPDAGDITSLADLRGKRIGVPGRFGSSWFALLVALHTAGLTTDDVDVVEIGYTQRAALATGNVDAVIGFTNNDLVQFQLAGVAVRALPIADGTPPLVGASLVTTRAYLAANPELVRGVAEAMVDGINAAAQDPDRALAVTQTQVPGLSGEALEAARATLTATLAIMTDSQGRTDGRLDLDAWQAMAAFMLDAGLLTAPADVAAATAPEVLP